jgi:hypothetical protein
MNRIHSVYFQPDRSLQKIMKGGCLDAGCLDLFLIDVRTLFEYEDEKDEINKTLSQETRREIGNCKSFYLLKLLRMF